jgi:hypothetical protein
MIAENKRTENEIAYRRLKPTIDRTYAKGRFIAIHNQQVVADAATLDELLATLASLGLNSKDCLAVQAGVDYPDFAFILPSGASTLQKHATGSTGTTENELKVFSFLSPCSPCSPWLNFDRTRMNTR